MKKCETQSFENKTKLWIKTKFIHFPNFEKNQNSVSVCYKLRKKKIIKMSSSSAPPSKNKDDIPLLQRPEVVNSFLHQNVIVGVAQNGFQSTVGLEGRLDAVDAMCNIALSNAVSPGLTSSFQRSKVAAVRGASVSFFGIPKQQQ